MATITGLTAARMIEIEDASIVDGVVDVDGNLILTKFDGSTINAGPVIGPTGATGAQGTPGVAGVSSIPGEIKMWPNDVLPSQGSYGKWVWADGGIYLAATYPIAASHINPAWKTAHGQSDPGAGNFRVPDLRGLVPAGLDQMPGGSRANRMTRSVAILIAGKSGTETHVVTVAEMPSHNHGGSVSVSGNTGGTDIGAFVNNLVQNNVQAGSGASFTYTVGGTAAGTSHSHGFSGSGSIPSQGSGGAHENVQPTVFVPYIVRLDG
jgi:microcystin-dependent protein